MTASRALARSPTRLSSRAILGADTRKFANLELRGLSRDGTFSGYASVFGEVDLGKDAIERGAFLRSLKTRGAGGVRMLFQHDPAEPIGAWRRSARIAAGSMSRASWRTVSHAPARCGS